LAATCLACSVIATTEKLLLQKIGKTKACTVFANYFCVCHYKKLQVIWYKLQTKPEQCVFATVLRA
jgi:hypothetical protein